jgi:outer membrane protein assembly factor BamA
VKSELSADRLIGSARPYGGGGFGELGARAYARLDLRDLPTNPRRGLLLELGGDVVAGEWDAEESFRGAHATLATYISAPTGWSPMLVVRAGARRVWGRYPYFEAARLGGGSSVRGYSTGRFMGDAAVFGQAEVRMPLGRAKLIVPGTLGVLGLADAGRVYLEGESSDIWHAGFGGGVWFSWLGGAKVISLAVARGTERTTLTFRAGAAF